MPLITITFGAVTLADTSRVEQQIQELGVNLMAQADVIKALLARVDTATTEVAKDVADLIAKIKAGAPDLLTPAEMAAAEANVARLETLGSSTDPATISAGTPTGPGGSEEPQPEV